MSRPSKVPRQPHSGHSEGGAAQNRIEAADNKFKRVEGLQYRRRWDTVDICGATHVHRVHSKFPVPGTAIKEDLDHVQKKAADVKRMEDGIMREARKTRNRRILKSNTAAFHTNIDFSVGVGAQLRESENVMQETYELLRPPKANGDTKAEVKRFWNNVTNGNANYIGYVMATGFRSINYQEPYNGDTGLHWAVKNGNLEMIEQLLIYRADPEIKNRLGYFPMHYAWAHWKPYTAFDRAQGKHIQQEKLTVDMLRLMCSYSTVPDQPQELDGQTPLHLAAKFGPLQAVITLMGFRAKHKQKDKRGVSRSKILLSSIFAFSVYQYVNILCKCRYFCFPPGNTV